MRPLYTLGFLILSLFSYAQTPTIISNHVIAGNCTALAYGNGLYVASAGQLFTSPNARTWTMLNDSVPAFALLAFGNGVFVGITTPSTINSYIYSSSDGVHWTQQTSVDGIAGELIFTGGEFWVVSNYLGEGPSSIVTSSDGVSWSGLDLGITIPTPITMNGVAYNGSVYVIGITLLATRDFPLGSSGVLYSTTAAPGSWNFAAITASNSLSGLSVKDVFYLYGGGIVTSTDGVNWTSFAGVDSMPDGSVSTVTGGAMFTAGDSLYLINGSTLAVSTDGTNFKSLPAPNLQMAGGLAVNGLAMIYGNGGLATATDGIHFNLDGTFFTALASNGSGYVAAGSNASGGSLFSSSDFVNWTYQLPVSYTSTVVYTGSKYVAAGSGNTYFAVDGTTWSTNTVAPSFTAMDYGTGRYVGGTSNNLLSSTDAINWSQVDSSNTYYYKIRYLNNGFFALGMNVQSGNGKILQSADGLHWTNITPLLDSGIAYYNDVMYDGTRYYFTGVKSSGGLFSIATTDPTNTNSYGAMGGIVNPAAGTSAVEYFPQFDDFIYHNGKYVGTVVNSVDGQSYLAYSTDGMNWTADSLGGSGHGRMTVTASDTFHIVAGDGGYYTVSFAETAPPTLLRFEAEAVRSFGGEDSRLRWEIKNDSGIAYYLVQHSLDTVRWDSIGQVFPEKRERATERYQFIQHDPPAGANYYRIGLIDRDGSRSWSPVRRVDIRKEGIRIYPNPARDVLHIQLPGNGPARLTVFSNAWLPVRQVDARGDHVSIDLWGLRPGIYYLQVFQDGKCYSAEFMIVE